MQFSSLTGIKLSSRRSAQDILSLELKYNFITQTPCTKTIPVVKIKPGWNTAKDGWEVKVKSDKSKCSVPATGISIQRILILTEGENKKRRTKNLSHKIQEIKGKSKAQLGMVKDQHVNTLEDFKRWLDKFIKVKKSMDGYDYQTELPWWRAVYFWMQGLRGNNCLGQLLPLFPASRILSRIWLTSLRERTLKHKPPCLTKKIVLCYLWCGVACISFKWLLQAMWHK